MLRKTAQVKHMKYSAGLSLVEMMVAMAMSLVVVAAMIGLMVNTLNNSNQGIQMSRLTQEMRTAMQMMSRDVRRAGYNSDAVLCYGNPECGTAGDMAGKIADDITINADNNCFYYQMDRDHDGDSTDNAYGGFRLGSASGTGTIEFWVDSESSNTEPDCDSTDRSCANDAWCRITDPDVIDVTAFNVNNDLSYEDIISDDGAGTQTKASVRKIALSITAELVNNDEISRELADIIRVRNDIIVPPPST